MYWIQRECEYKCIGVDLALYFRKAFHGQHTFIRRAEKTTPNNDIHEDDTLVIHHASCLSIKKTIYIYIVHPEEVIEFLRKRFFPVGSRPANARLHILFHDNNFLFLLFVCSFTFSISNAQILIHHWALAVLEMVWWRLKLLLCQPVYQYSYSNVFIFHFRHPMYIYCTVYWINRQMIEFQCKLYTSASSTFCNFFCAHSRLKRDRSFYSLLFFRGQKELFSDAYWMWASKAAIVSRHTAPHYSEKQILF